MDLGSFGWLTHEDQVIAFALWHLLAHDLRLRTVSQVSATRYHCNPLTPRTWRDFVDSRTAQFSQACSRDRRAGLTRYVAAVLFVVNGGLVTWRAAGGPNDPVAADWRVADGQMAWC